MGDNGIVLVVDDERPAVRNLEHVLTKEGYRVLATTSGAAALDLLERERVDVVLTDLRMEKVDGMAVLARSRAIDPATEVILITGYASLESAVEAMRQGAFYYIAKPFRLDEVRKVVAEAMEKVRLKRENRDLRRQIEQMQGPVRIVTQDALMQRLLDTARQVAPTDCNVLISGESGTGKELLARWLHHHSRRAAGPFVAVNCGAFHEELLANELFGHDKGAFTGAADSRGGLVEAACGGTLFLDEVTEMPPSMQVKLLRVIQEREVMRLGSTRTQVVDVRFVAATNRDMQETLAAGRLRQDLYFRLNVVGLHAPPLAARKGDIPLLAHYFLKKHGTLMGKAVAEIAPEAAALLADYDYPGNVRELENIIARAVALAAAGCIEAVNLPDELRDGAVRTFRREEGRILSLEEQEAAYLRWVLKEVNGNRTLAARSLGIDRVSLWRRLKKLGVEEGRGE